MESRTAISLWIGKKPACAVIASKKKVSLVAQKLSVQHLQPLSDHFWLHRDYTGCLPPGDLSPNNYRISLTDWSHIGTNQCRVANCWLIYKRRRSNWGFDLTASKRLLLCYCHPDAPTQGLHRDERYILVSFIFMLSCEFSKATLVQSTNTNTELIACPL